jgi:hypothetical protein
MSKRPLTQQELLALSEQAEYGGLDHTTASKRHVRILTSLHFVLDGNQDDHSTLYANLETIQTLIERFFGKRYNKENLLYWVDDLCKRGYLSEYHEGEIVEKNFFSLTEYGIALSLILCHAREALFESNSKNSLAFLH